MHTLFHMTCKARTDVKGHAHCLSICHYGLAVTPVHNTNLLIKVALVAMTKSFLMSQLVLF